MTSEQDTESSPDVPVDSLSEDGSKRQKLGAGTQTSDSSEQTVSIITQPNYGLMDRKVTNESKRIENNDSDIKIQSVCSIAPIGNTQKDGTFTNDTISFKSHGVSDFNVQAVASFLAKPDAEHTRSFANEFGTLRTPVNASDIKIQSVRSILAKPSI